MASTRSKRAPHSSSELGATPSKMSKNYVTETIASAKEKGTKGNHGNDALLN